MSLQKSTGKLHNKRVLHKDYFGNTNNLHAVISNPSEYCRLFMDILEHNPTEQVYIFAAPEKNAKKIMKSDSRRR